MTNYQNLIIKSFSGELTDHEKIILAEWLDRSKKNKLQLKHLENIWINSSAINNPPEYEIDSDWLLLQNKLEQPRGLKPIHKNFFSLFRLNFIERILLNWKPALVSVCAVFIAVIIYFVNKPDEQLINYSTFGKGKETVLLPDGSQVLLNSNSKIEYSFSFDDKTRKVKLTGEGYFSIRKDEKPFTVECANALVTVKGTEFNVIANKNRTTVFVKEGKVNLTSLESENSGIEIVSGFISDVKNYEKPTVPVKADSQNILSWLNNKLIFNRKSLPEIVDELEKYYKVRIDFKNNPEYNEKITSTFDNVEIDSVLKMICLTTNLRYKKVPHGYEIIQSDK